MTPKGNFRIDLKPHLVRVLIADDSQQVIRDLRQLLELTGVIEVVGEAEDGLEVVRLAASLSPEVVVMDLEMPLVDGYIATAQIKEKQPDLRVVILSGHAGSGEVERARAAGADDFVQKGASYLTLLNAILGMGGQTDTFGKGENV